MHPLLEELGEDGRERLVPCRPPAVMKPMLATPAVRRIPEDGWLYERKYDGVRCMVFCDNGGVRLLSRNMKRLNDTYPELEDAVTATVNADFIADGEVVAFDGDATSFSRLQTRMQVHDRHRARRSGVPVYYYLFDLMHLEGYDLCALPLQTRKQILQRLIPFKDPLRYSEHRNENGLAYYREACQNGWEGIIAKRASGRYLQRRSTDWLKFKCVRRQEFVIGGFTEPRGSRRGFGALIIGYYENGSLISAGKVGTGFDDETLQALSRRLAGLKQEQSPFSGRRRPERGEHFVTPELVCEVAFTEWTPDGRLRHPRYLGLRHDKAVRDVVRESGG